MPEQAPESSSLKLPDNPSLEWLRKQAKTRLAELQQANPGAKLAEAQFEIAKRYRFFQLAGAKRTPRLTIR